MQIIKFIRIPMCNLHKTLKKERGYHPCPERKAAKTVLKQLLTQYPRPDYTTQITEKQSEITTLNSEIEATQKAIEENKTTLKDKRVALKKAEKELSKLEAKKAAADQKAAEEAKKAEAEEVLKKLLASGMSAEKIIEKLK